MHSVFSNLKEEEKKKEKDPNYNLRADDVLELETRNVLKEV